MCYPKGHRIIGKPIKETPYILIGETQGSPKIELTKKKHLPNIFTW